MRPLCHAVLALLLSAVPASAQTAKALNLVPDEALGFILVKDLRQLSDKVEEMAEKLKVAERVSLLEMLQVEGGIGQGLRAKGSAVFIVMKGEKEKSEPAVVIALPVADYPEVARQFGVKKPMEGINEGKMGSTSSLLAGIGGSAAVVGKAKKVPVLLAAKGEFVLLASPDRRKTLERVLHARKSIMPSLQVARDWLGEQDACGVCTHHGVQVGLAMLLAGPGGGVADSTQGQAARLKGTYAEVEKNVKLIAFGARIEKAGHPRLLTRVYFDPDGPYAKWLAKAEPVKGKVLAQLPRGPYVLAALAHISPQTNFEGLMKLLWNDLSPDEQAKQLSLDAARLLQRISDVGLGLYNDTARDNKSPGAEVNLWGAVVAKVDDASRFIEDTVALLKKAERTANAGQKDKVELRFEQRQIAGKPSRLITFRDVKTGQPDGNRIKDGSARKKPAVVVFTAVDSRTVLACALPDAGQAEATVKKFAKQPGQALSNDPLLRTTAVLLPPRRQAAAYLNIQTLGVLGFPADGTPESPPLGFSLSTFPAGVEAQFVIPFGALQALFKGARSPSETK